MPWSVASFAETIIISDCELWTLLSSTLRSFHMSIIHILQSSKYGAWNIPPRLNRDARFVCRSLEYLRARSSAISQRAGPASIPREAADQRWSTSHWRSYHFPRTPKSRPPLVREVYVSVARQLPGIRDLEGVDRFLPWRHRREVAANFRREYSSGGDRSVINAPPISGMVWPHLTNVRSRLRDPCSTAYFYRDVSCQRTKCRYLAIR